MNIIDLTNNITRCEALIQQYQNSELYTETEKEKRINALNVEITRYRNQLTSIQKNTPNQDLNIRNVY